MTTLTRRPDAYRPDCWQIYYDGDIHIGSIGTQPGLPIHTDQWRWDVGFYPVEKGGTSRSGYAASFDLARTAFEAAWRDYLPQCTEADFAEHRRQNAFTAWKQRMWETGAKLPTQTASGRAVCYCGAPLTIATMSAHVYGSHLVDAHSR